MPVRLKTSVRLRSLGLLFLWVILLQSASGQNQTQDPGQEQVLELAEGQKELTISWNDIAPGSFGYGISARLLRGETVPVLAMRVSPASGYNIDDLKLLNLECVATTVDKTDPDKLIRKPDCPKPTNSNYLLDKLYELRTDPNGSNSNRLRIRAKEGTRPINKRIKIVLVFNTYDGRKSGAEKIRPLPNITVTVEPEPTVKGDVRINSKTVVVYTKALLYWRFAEDTPAQSDSLTIRAFNGTFQGEKQFTLQGQGSGSRDLDIRVGLLGEAREGGRDLTITLLPNRGAPQEAGVAPPASPPPLALRNGVYTGVLGGIKGPNGKDLELRVQVQSPPWILFILLGAGVIAGFVLTNMVFLQIPTQSLLWDVRQAERRFTARNAGMRDPQSDRPLDNAPQAYGHEIAQSVLVQGAALRQRVFELRAQSFIAVDVSSEEFKKLRKDVGEFETIPGRWAQLGDTLWALRRYKEELQKILNNGGILTPGAAGAQQRFDVTQLKSDITAIEDSLKKDQSAARDRLITEAIELHRDFLIIGEEADKVVGSFRQLIPSLTNQLGDLLIRYSGVLEAIRPAPRRAPFGRWLSSLVKPMAESPLGRRILSALRAEAPAAAHDTGGPGGAPGATPRPVRLSTSPQINWALRRLLFALVLVVSFVPQFQSSLSQTFGQNPGYGTILDHWLTFFGGIAAAAGVNTIQGALERLSLGRLLGGR